VLTSGGAYSYSALVAAPQDPFYVELGRRIRTARKEKKLTQEKLASVVQLTRTSITNIECGRQPVLAHHLAALARALDVSIESLLASPSDTPSPQLEAKLRNLQLPEDKRDWVTRVVSTTS
jgi:transcriptional regulator with XRE-family HTH domain